MEGKLKEVSEELKNCTDIQTYLCKLYEYIKTFSFSDVVKVHKINFTLKYSSIKRANYSLKYWEMSVTDSFNVTSQFTESHFGAQCVFLEKLKYDATMQYSIDRYGQRLNETKLKAAAREENMALDANEEDKVSLNIYDYKESEDFGRDKEKEPIKKDRISRMSVAQKQESDEISETKRIKATDIIRKLFVKKFNPGDNPADRSKNKQRWVDVINKYIDKKNVAVDTFVDSHIEKLPNTFSDNFFFGDDINITKNKNTELVSVYSDQKEDKSILMARNDNSSYHSSASRKSQDIVFAIKNQIKMTQSNKQKRLQFVIYGFYLVIVMWVINFIFPLAFYFQKNVSILNPIFSSDIFKIRNVMSDLMSTQVYHYKKYIQNYNITNAASKVISSSGGVNIDTSQVISTNVTDASGYIQNTTSQSIIQQSGIESTVVIPPLADLLQANCIKSLNDIIVFNETDFTNPSDRLYYYMQNPYVFSINNTATNATLISFFKLLEIEITEHSMFKSNNLVGSLLETNKYDFIDTITSAENRFKDLFRLNADWITKMINSIFLLG